MKFTSFIETYLMGAGRALSKEEEYSGFLWERVETSWKSTVGHFVCLYGFSISDYGSARCVI